MPEAVPTTHPRAPVTREASRHATRYNKRLALPSAPAPCHNSRVMGRPPVPQRTLSSDRPEEFAGLSRHRTTRRSPARRRPGPAPIVVGSRWRVGRPRSRFPRRRRRGLHDGVAMNAPRSCCSERRRRAGLGRRTGASGRRAVSHTAPSTDLKRCSTLAGVCRGANLWLAAMRSLPLEPTQPRFCSIALLLVSYSR